MIDDNILLDMIPKYHADPSDKNFYIVSKDRYPIGEPGFMFFSPMISVQYSTSEEMIANDTKIFNLTFTESMYFDQIATNRSNKIGEILE